MEWYEELTAYDWAFWVAGVFALLELARWLYSIKDFLLKTVGIKTRDMIRREEYENRLKKVEAAIEEIKETSKHNVNMFLEHEKQVVGQFRGIRDEIVGELNKLHDKMDEQSQEIAENQRKNEKTDRNMLRDRINSGMRYFSQNKDENGNVHISLRDYEIMDGLFQDYFSKKGNGPVGKSYEDEFKKFIIDR